jgi:hypothetical protein
MEKQSKEDHRNTVIECLSAIRKKFMDESHQQTRRGGNKERTGRDLIYSRRTRARQAVDVLFNTAPLTEFLVCILLF